MPMAISTTSISIGLHLQRPLRFAVYFSVMIYKTHCQLPMALGAQLPAAYCLDLAVAAGCRCACRELSPWMATCDMCAGAPVWCRCYRSGRRDTGHWTGVPAENPDALGRMGLARGRMGLAWGRMGLACGAAWGGIISYQVNALRLLRQSR
jgi:hypothetical protein